MAAAELEELRKTIDKLDTALVHLLAERFQATKQVGQYKKAHNLTPIDPAREARQFAKIEKLAIEAGLDPDFAKRILRVIIDQSVKNHLAIRE